MAFPGFEQVPPTLGAGLAGAVTGAITMTGTIWQRIAAGIAGAFSSVFLGPVAAPFVHAGIELFDRRLLGDVITIDIMHITSFTGFILGMTGMVIVRGVQKITTAAADRAARTIKGD